MCYHNPRGFADYGKLGHAEAVSVRIDGLGTSVAEVARLEQLVKAKEQLEKLQKGTRAFYSGCAKHEKEKEARKKAEKELPAGETLVLEPLHPQDGTQEQQQASVQPDGRHPRTRAEHVPTTAGQTGR